MAEQKQIFRELLARAWKDEDFKNKLISDPKKTLAEAGLEFPSNIHFKIHENTADTIHLVIPRNPADSEISEEALEKLSGAGTIDTCYNTTCPITCYL